MAPIFLPQLSPLGLSQSQERIVKALSVVGRAFHAWQTAASTGEPLTTTAGRALARAGLIADFRSLDGALPALKACAEARRFDPLTMADFAMDCERSAASMAASKLGLILSAYEAARERMRQDAAARQAASAV